MASLIYLGLTLLTAVASASPSSRIIGGNEVSIQNFPSVVQVEALQQGIAWLHHCGGSILTSTHVLSAAHCFAGNSYAPENRRIRAGSAALESGGVLVYVEQAFNHPTYGQNGNDGDITVVRLNSGLIFSPTVNQGLFVISGSNFPAGVIVTKVGWGVTSVESPIHSPSLVQVNVPIIDNNLCRLTYGSLSSAPVVTPNMICAGSSTADSCTGDAGGPVFIGNVVVGVISWGNGCLIPGFPGVNTAVSPYSDWIVDTVTS